VGPKYHHERITQPAQIGILGNVSSVRKEALHLEGQHEDVFYVDEYPLLHMRYAGHKLTPAAAVSAYHSFDDTVRSSTL
jgi:hypothetical protein